MEVHNCENENVLIPAFIKYAEWESSGNASPNTGINKRPCARKDKDSIYRGVNFYRKIVTKSSPAFFIIIDSIKEFIPCFRVK